MVVGISIDGETKRVAETTRMSTLKGKRWGK